jgi:chromate reductase
MQTRTKSHQVAVLVGSLRPDGFTDRLADALITVAPEHLALHKLDISDLPLYRADREVDPPSPWLRFRGDIKAADAVLFVTPEYNRSVPGGLKNAIDVASRPYDESAFERKPAAIASQSPGPMGGFGANHALRQSLVFLDMPTLQQPELYLGGSARLLVRTGMPSDEGVRSLLKAFMDAFALWIERYARA